MNIFNRMYFSMSCKRNHKCYMYILMLATVKLIEHSYILLECTVQMQGCV